MRDSNYDITSLMVTLGSRERHAHCHECIDRSTCTSHGLVPDYGPAARRGSTLTASLGGPDEEMEPPVVRRELELRHGEICRTVLVSVR